MTGTTDVWAALLAVQGQIRGVKKDSRNPHFKNNYASLEAVTDTIRPHMQEHGLVWLQSPGAVHDGSIQVTTRIHHPESGTFHEFTMEMPMAKRDPQGAGSALTYAMRYSLMAALGLPPTDDDAETAIDRNGERAAPEASARAGQDKPASKADARPIYASLEQSMRRRQSKAELNEWIKNPETRELRAKLPPDWDANLRQAAADYGRDLPDTRDDSFPGDMPNGSGIHDASGRELSNMEA